MSKNDKTAKTAKSAKVLAQQKHRRRQWLTFIRMLRYGINNFTRNSWLTVAATAVMTITLLVVFVSVAAQNVLSDTTAEVAKKIDRSIYLKTGTTAEQAEPIMNDLKKLSNVDSVTFVSSEQGKQKVTEENKTDLGTLNALKEATNRIPAAVKITLKNPNDTRQLITFVKTNEPLKQYIDSSTQPTFMSNRKVATDTIANWTRVAQRAGVIMSVLFAGISILVIFNTIRMAIFNRRDEIEMMKLIGAEKSFIRGPFLVEAMVYGFIAAVVATIAGYATLFAVHDKAAAWGVTIAPTIDLLTVYIGLVLLGMIVLGALVGIISSWLATRRYLKI